MASMEEEEVPGSMPNLRRAQVKRSQGKEPISNVDLKRSRFTVSALLGQTENDADGVVRLKSENRRLEGLVRQLQRTVMEHAVRNTVLERQLAEAETIRSDKEAELDIARFERDVTAGALNHFTNPFTPLPSERPSVLRGFYSLRTALATSRSWTETTEAVQVAYNNADRYLNRAVEAYDKFISGSRFMRVVEELRAIRDRLARSQDEAWRLNQALQDATRRLYQPVQRINASLDRGRIELQEVGAEARRRRNSSVSSDSSMNSPEIENEYDALFDVDGEDEEEEEEEDDDIFGEPECIEGDALVSSEFGKCTICYEEEVTNPVGCFRCKAHIGCRSCVRHWIRVSPRDLSEDFTRGRSTAPCPLCRAIWTRGEHYVLMSHLDPRETADNDANRN